MSHPHNAQPHGQVVDIHPAGASYSSGHHSHVVVSKRVLVVVLSLLMFFTLLTVGAAQAEAWAAHRFDIIIPQWVNVAVALSIAAVKSMIVAGFFMQLRYDNPMNSAVAIFTIMVLAFFLGFTMLDLGARDAIYPYKAAHIIRGGIGGIDTGTNGQVPTGTSIAQYARIRAEEQIAKLEAEGKPLPKVLAHYKEMKAGGGHGGHGGGGHATGSSADKSRAKKGVTLPELGGGHDAHGGEPAKPAGDAKPAEAAQPAKTGH
ncbi:MAG: cytochrome C oxidase subunit IV family protein [Phycisphaerales bacterium]